MLTAAAAAADVVIRGLNSLYRQAPYVAAADAADFVGYALSWIEFAESEFSSPRPPAGRMPRRSCCSSCYHVGRRRRARAQTTSATRRPPCSRPSRRARASRA